MNYYEVLVTSNKYHGSEPLTYSSTLPLLPGQIVLVKIRNAASAAIVIKPVDQPKFKTKDVTSLLVEKPLPPQILKLINWLHEYYPSPISFIANQFVPGDLLVKKLNLPEFTDQKTEYKSEKLPKLSRDQAVVMKEIASSKSHTFMLHGITGSGKTRIYIDQAQKTIKANQSVIIMTPEISLTPQLSNMLKSSLDAEVLVVHSNMTPKERREVWLKVLYSVSPQVIVGPRSALFSPVSNLGLIVLDEFHDAAYKQEQSPHYHALRVAGALANSHKAALIYGSATPTVTEYYIAQQKKVPILKLNTIAAGFDAKAKVSVIDTKDRSQFGKNSYFSDLLLQTIQASIDKGEQSLVFLNRRGTARLVICQNCDWQALCPNCDLPLTYHGDSHIMRCHTCGYKQSPPLSCPVCSSPDIIYKSFGTKAIEFQLRRLFPEARISRFDNDNNKNDRFDKHYDAVRGGNVDILVGTQILVKGLDLPKLSTVGVVAADSSLYFPDYLADEQTYQLLSQVMGRVARGHRDGSVIIQTHNPNSLPLKAAVDKDWQLFYDQQLIERKNYTFPPFCFLLKLTCSRKSREAAMEAALKLAKLISTLPIKAQVIGPAPRFIEKNNGTYNWQVTVKSKSRDDLLKVIAKLPANWHYDIDPSNLL